MRRRLSRCRVLSRRCWGATRNDNAAVVACCHAVVALRPCVRPVTVAPTPPRAPVVPTPSAPVAGATAGTPLPTWLVAVVTAVPTVVTVLPTTTTTGAVALGGSGAAGGVEPVAPTVPGPVGPLWGAAGDGTNVTVVPGGSSAVTAGGGPLCPVWVSCPVRNVCRASLEPDDAASAPPAPAGPGDSPAGEPERSPAADGSRCAGLEPTRPPASAAHHLRRARRRPAPVVLPQPGRQHCQDRVVRPRLGRRCLGDLRHMGRAVAHP